MMAPSSNLAPVLYNSLSNAFAEYSDLLERCSTDVEGSRRRLQQLEEQWHASGLTGQHTVELLRSFRAHIAWERMVPDTFNKFYRFVFHLCKQAHRKHIPAELAVEVWQLLLMGRFRLLDKWCDYMAQRKPSLKVINEDQWRQVLDFSRSVHEDLSNYDPNGAWACFLDEFVEHLSSSRPGSRSQLMDEDLGFSVQALMVADDLNMVNPVPISPRCGSKRRSPDVDVVVERLSAIPLPSSQSDQLPVGHAAEPAGCMGPWSMNSPGNMGSEPATTYSVSSLGANNCSHAAVTPSGRTPCSAAKRHCTEGTRPSGQQVVGSVISGMVLPAPQSLFQQPMVPVLTSPSAACVPAAPCIPAPLPPEPQPQPPQTFTLELPMLQVSGRRHLRSRRSNVSELVHNTVSEALFQ